ncbi:NADH-cytochrome b5 reductase-like protein [Gossypium raimondii]|uniref:NADH-cytochrome b5 reductase-like protein n=1 Tax=Gossypium raimondii TaxID=29730 RepID=UPI00227AB22D|nr:NADH-cytochrome b5 reductase-like protein [Gossypium raimondii]
MAIFFKKLAKSTSASFNTAFVGKPKSGSAVFSFSAITDRAGGFSTYYYISESESNFCGHNECYYDYSRTDMNSFTIGHLDQINEETGPKVALKSDKWLELQDSARVSHNSHLFRFSFDPAAKLGLDVAACILTRAPLGQNAEGKTKYVIRPLAYVPISDPDAMGHFDLLIKVYPEGKMSQIFATLKPGDVLEVKGPIEKLRYSPNMKKHIGMIAGGTGITPMLQVIDAIVKNPNDNTQVYIYVFSLLYANVSPDDILLKQKLDILEAGHPNLKVFYTVDNPTKKWKGSTRYTSKDMVTKGLPGPSDDTLIFVCGPPGMMEHICGGKAKDHSQGQLTGILKELGYTEQMVYQF